MCLPTEKGHLQALRTQQILAYETGVTNVADPLGGSYYVESLTDKVEEEALKIMRQVEDLGGMEEAILHFRGITTGRRRLGPVFEYRFH